MVVACPDCASSFITSANPIAADKQTVRCLKCASRWHIPADSSSPPRSRSRPVAKIPSNLVTRSILASKGKAIGATRPGAPAMHETPIPRRIIEAENSGSVRKWSAAGCYRLFRFVVEAIVLVMLGEYEKAAVLYRRYRQPGRSIAYAGTAMPIIDPRGREKCHIQLRKAGRSYR